jgi:butyryl-CoA dehydrogenase
MKGEIPLDKEARKAFESLLSPSLDEVDPSVPYAAEMATLANLKKIFLILSGAAVKRFGAGLKDEQEVLLAAADVAIQIFAAESTVLRAAQIRAGLSEARRALVDAAVKVHTFRASEKVATAAKRGAFYVSEGDELAMVLGGVRRFTKYDASGLLAAKRVLAAAVVEGERYPL